MVLAPGAHAALGVQALDAFVLRSAHDPRGALPQMLPVVLQCLAHDPNCEDDMDAEDGSGGDEEEDECAPGSCQAPWPACL